jgi:hypothetical protein
LALDRLEAEEEATDFRKGGKGGGHGVTRGGQKKENIGGRNN